MGNFLHRRRACTLALLLVASALACNAPFLVETPATPTRQSQTTMAAPADDTGPRLTCDQPAMVSNSIGPDRRSEPQDEPTERPPAEDTEAPAATEPQPTATAEEAVATNTPEEAAPTMTPEVGPLRSHSFLELPFPYDGGNENFGGSDEQFVQASQRTANDGRINSFFDHLLPLYPAKHDGREPADPPEAERVLRYDGQLSERDYYSGHPAYDYSTYVPRTPTTPVFAAAYGVVQSVGECCGGALVVRILHEVEGVGDYRTTYMHLHPDEYYEGAKELVGQPIEAGTRIGTMGNTGWSTGHHLHFEVRFDANQDERFPLEEVVDPYGFIPSGQYSNDPWAQRSASAPKSRYLWRHPLGSQGRVPDEGGGELRISASIGGGDQLGTFCAQPGSLPADGSVTVANSPDPPAAPGLVGSGTSFTVSVSDSQGEPVEEIEPPAIIHIPLDPGRLAALQPNTEAVYWFAPIEREWFQVPASVDREAGLLLAEIARTGLYALLGDPVEDVYRPRTEILLNGPTGASGAFYDHVTVTLRSDDPSGIDRIEYSLDNGTSWQEYEEPFMLERSGIPEDLYEGEEPSEVFGGGPGRFLVLASATDGAGNVEDPPAFRMVTIDPREAPRPTATPTSAAPPSINFNADDYEIQQGSCTTLRWNVENADAVELEGDAVPPTDAEQVCPQSTRQYQLAAENAETSETASVTIQVSAVVTEEPEMPPSAPAGLSISNKVCSSPDYIVTLGWSDQASNEEGYRVYRDGGVIATLSANATSYSDEPPGSGPYTYGVEAFNDAGSSSRPTVNEAGCIF